MTIILHHYEASPFSEKIRAILGFKGMDYQSVLIPPIMPKPDLTTLTGGYRRTPVMQIGADIYCDTRLICRALDEHTPAPSLYPAAVSAAAETLAQWADDVFFRIAVGMVFTPQGIAAFRARMSDEQMAAFLADRQKMTTSGKNPSQLIAPDVAASHFAVYMQAFDDQLAQSDFIFGSNPNIADFSLYHCVWFVANNSGLAPLLKSYQHVGRWLLSMKAFGQGTPSDLSSGEAVDIAQAAEPQKVTQRVETQRVDSDQMKEGDKVSVMETALGIDPVEGHLVKLAGDEIIIKRTSARAGEVYVHYPRIGYQITGSSG